MRGAARGLIAALLAVALAAAAAEAWVPPGFERAVGELDGGQYLEDEPIWLCDESEPHPGMRTGELLHDFAVVGLDERGRRIPGPGHAGMRAAPASRIDPGNLRRPRAGEFVQSLALPSRTELHVLGPWPGHPGGLPAGQYEVRRGSRWSEDADTSQVLARFRVLRPRGAELAVRAALARAARLAADPDTSRHAEAARLYGAVLARYPRTTYRTLIYAGLWRVRAFTPYGRDPGSWLEEVFAHYNSACFGVWALDGFMADMPADEARPLLRRLVGLYPDTLLSRAARRYL